MSFFATATFSGGLGQLVSGYIVASTSWRWIYWHQLIINGMLMLAIAIFFKETRGPVLLSRKAKALNTITEVFKVIPSATSKSLESSTSMSLADFTPYPNTQTHWRVESDEQRAKISRMIKLSLTRPFCEFISFRTLHMLNQPDLLFTEPVVFWFSMWISLSWALIFLFFESVPLIFRTSYGFSPQQTGLVFISMCVGAILGNIFYPFQENLYRRYGHQLPNLAILKRARSGWHMQETASNTADNPEARLYSACILSIFMAFGMFMWVSTPKCKQHNWAQHNRYGATSFPSAPWIFPAIAILVVTFGAHAIYLSVFTYFADMWVKIKYPPIAIHRFDAESILISYTTYASSAMAAQSFCRNILAGCLPLVVNISKASIILPSLMDLPISSMLSTNWEEPTKTCFWPLLVFRRLTFVGAASLLGGIALLLR